MAEVRSTPRILRDIYLGRFRNFISSSSFEDVNLHSQLIKHRTNLPEFIELNVYSVPNLQRIPFAEAVKAKYRPTHIGERFGPSWSTHWFQVKLRIPADWAGEEVWFVWDNRSEALLWSSDGIPLQGFTGSDDGGNVHREYILTQCARGDDKYTFYVEMACNALFGNGSGTIQPPDPNRFFTLSTADLAVPRKEVWQLLHDFEIIRQMASDLPADSQRAADALYTANEIINTFSLDDPESIKRARQVAAEYLKISAGDHGHRITAIGNCHIDTAWLWPFDETKRKIARSFSRQIRLMEQYPEFKFTASQAQQFAWLKELYPELFAEVQEMAKQGRFIPIGGTWVEMDCNVPSGESFCRQFLYGQRFFEKNFGHRCKVFWLPDTFGYSSQLPQIIVKSGMKYFFTQKLSWNNINRFPNTSFYWIGLDGSKVLTHMAPSETYVAQCNVSELQKSVNNNHDKEYSRNSLLLFGNGDGGGGPLPAMIERLRRLRSLDPLPKVEIASPNEFYERLEKESKDLVGWKGELYFELHRGTYTSHGHVKWYNRKNELLLRDLEFAAAIYYSGISGNYRYPREELDEFWKAMLLNQFHDVLPGSSIELVYIDARRHYKEVQARASKLLDEAVNNLWGLKEEDTTGTEHKGILVLNTLPFTRTEVIRVPAVEGLQQYANDGSCGYAVVHDAISMGSCAVALHRQAEIQSVHVENSNGKFVLRNQYIAAEFDPNGRLISLKDIKLNRELVPEGKHGNVFKIYEDIPLFWDAWDVEIYHLEKFRTITNGSIKIQERGPLRSSLELSVQLSERSTLKQTIVLTAISRRLDFETEIEWNENRQFLKVEFPLDITADYATYETQFGHIERPTHYNTSWDAAKFEVCAHKYADLSEYGYGVALLNDCKYGYATHGNVIRLSLLRSPKAPDAHSDLGKHYIKYALYPHEGHFMQSDVVEQAYRFNIPLITRICSRKFSDDLKPTSYFSLHGARNVLIETVKLAEDSDEIILRLYEAYGGKARVSVKSTLPIESVHQCNILEDTELTLQYHPEEGLKLNLKPFEVITLKVALSHHSWEFVHHHV
ncbi:uncharacterized protein VTP21DRAFT_4609 [Calcarisporiella thermophila]|uniref:uncharacterized protein n=1 Tax=Calcarisporiella thermophila TaxID=911321 RepID=UPI0037434FD7